MQSSEFYLAGTIQFRSLITPVNVIKNFLDCIILKFNLFLTTDISAKWQNVMLTQFCLFVCSWFHNLYFIHRLAVGENFQFILIFTHFATVLIIKNSISIAFMTAFISEIITLSAQMMIYKKFTFYLSYTGVQKFCTEGK